MPPLPTDRPVATWPDQAVFDFVVNHIREQGEPAIANPRDIGCRYRAKNAMGKTCSCAVGCLIPDEMFAAHGIEGGLRRLMEQPEIRDWLVGDVIQLEHTRRYRLLGHLQDVHDEWGLKDLGGLTLAESFTNVANKYGLIDYAVRSAPLPNAWDHKERAA